MTPNDTPRDERMSMDDKHLSHCNDARISKLRSRYIRAQLTFSLSSASLIGVLLRALGVVDSVSEEEVLAGASAMAYNREETSLH